VLFVGKDPEWSDLCSRPIIDPMTADASDGFLLDSIMLLKIAFAGNSAADFQTQKSAPPSNTSAATKTTRGRRFVIARRFVRRFHLASSDSFNGKPQATTFTRISVACGLPLNEECAPYYKVLNFND